MNTHTEVRRVRQIEAVYDEFGGNAYAMAAAIWEARNASRPHAVDTIASAAYSREQMVRDLEPAGVGGGVRV
jgi:hypothetical protein